MKTRYVQLQRRWGIGGLTKPGSGEPAVEHVRVKKPLFVYTRLQRYKVNLRPWVFAHQPAEVQSCFFRQT